MTARSVLPRIGWRS